MDNYEDAKIKLLEKLRFLKESSGAKTAKKLNLHMLERCINRSISFAGECNECRNYIVALGELLERLIDELSSHKKDLIRDYHIYLKKLMSHLQKTHSLIPDGYYMGMWMSLGLGLGVSFGAAFHNMGIGLPIGLSVGVAIGSGMDANAKKSGKVI